MYRNAKTIVWLHGEIKSPPFSMEARIKTGHYLRLLQEGKIVRMPKARPMPSIGQGCLELRINDTNCTWRVICAIDDTNVIVLDIFSKKTRSTPDYVIKKCKKRLNDYRSEKLR
jgi:phage-related protein